MLPDFPVLKSIIQRRQVQAFQQQHARFAPLFGGAKHFRIHEGDKHVSIGQDGDRQVLRPRRFETRFEVRWSEFERLTPQAVEEKLTAAAQEMAGQTERHAFEYLDKEISRHGMAVDAKGRPFGPELMLEMFSRMDLDFDESGNPRLPAIFVGPSTAAAIAPKLAEWDRDPELKRRFHELINRKREEWRDRESRRELVD